ncbi:MAG: hemerythrin domain-containing protein [Phycisphaerae bacterium]
MHRASGRVTIRAFLLEGMPMSGKNSRRSFLKTTTTGAGLILLGCTNKSLAADDDKKKEEQDENKVTPGEDLMQEHGVLKRILLIYGEGIRRIDAHQDLPPETIKQSAELVRSFVEDYHEQNEEHYLFPRLKQAHKLTDLVDTLLTQHKAGRIVTDRMIHLSTQQTLHDEHAARDLSNLMQQFIRMYSAHEAREDTVLFPAFRDLLTKNEYDALGETFEDEEHKHFGADGFDLAVDKVAQLEKTLGIYDLNQFTPHV